MCRKKGKLPPPIVSETYSLEYGEDTLEIQPGTGKVVIVDDVYATGGTMDAVEKLCIKAGYTVIDKLTLIDLKYLHGKTNVKSLIQYE
jgi:adenine phosphoribosyltransferase